MIKVALVGIMTALLALQLREIKPEYSIYLGLAGSVLLIFLMSGQLEWMLDTVQSLFSYLNLSSVYLSMILKLVGISYLADFASSICQEAGQATLGKQIELFARLTIFGLSFPVIQALFQTLDQL
ncbi:MAG: SpoIIIAC/SpoIIIAD family protein [Lachnospiraceae bacterium]